MRIPSRIPEALNRREQLRRDRAAAQTLRSAFPAVELISLQLQFEDAGTPPPATQSHVLHPPARAFFEFPCPYANCDGKFDLNAAAALLMKRSVAHTEGVLECPGMRSRTVLTKQPCGVRVRYAISAQYHSKV